MTFADDVLQLHARGLRNYEIARELGCAPNTVTWHLTTRGLVPNNNKCRNNHSWTPENTYMTSQGHRACRACHRNANRRSNGWKPRPDRTAFDHDFFAHNKPISPWLAGFVAADGCVRDHRRWTLGQSGPAGLKLMQTVASLIGHLPGPRMKATETLPAYIINVSSEKQVNDLATIWHVKPRKSLTLPWPHPDPALASAFIRGYVDGDGHVGGSGKDAVFSVVGTPEFITGLRSTLQIQGGYLRCHSERTVTLQFRNAKARAALRWIFQDGGLPESAKTKKARDLLQ